MSFFKIPYKFIIKNFKVFATATVLGILIFISALKLSAHNKDLPNESKCLSDGSLSNQFSHTIKLHIQNNLENHDVKWCIEREKHVDDINVLILAPKDMNVEKGAKLITLTEYKNLQISFEDYKDSLKNVSPGCKNNPQYLDFDSNTHIFICDSKESTQNKKFSKITFGKVKYMESSTYLISLSKLVYFSDADKYIINDEDLSDIHFLDNIKIVN